MNLIMPKQIFFAGLLIGLAMVCSVRHCACVQLELEDYLDLPKPREFDEPFHKDAREALLALNIFKSSTSNDIMGQVDERNQKSTNSDDDAAKRPIYRALANMRPKQGNSCNQKMANVLKSLVAQMRADPEGELSKKLSNFIMKDFGRDVIIDCLMKFRSSFISFEQSKDLADLDEFFIVGLGLRGTIHATSNYQRNLELGNALRDSDLTSERLEVKEMLAIARKSSGKTIESPDQDVLVEFISDKCEKLKSLYATELDFCNLARAIGEREILSPPVIKLNEYNRVCLAWSKPDKRSSIVANLMRQI